MKKRDIAKSATLVTAMMLAFKLLGFIKQAVIAYCYGASFDTDIYFIAWGFITGVSEAIVKALSVSLVAVYTGLLFGKGKIEASRLINGIIEIMLPIFIFIAILLVAMATSISYILAPSYDSFQIERLSCFIRMLAPILLFVYIELVFGAVLDSNKSFFIPRMQSFIYSIITMICCVLCAVSLGTSALVIAQYSSSILFSCILFIAVKRYHDFFIVKLKDIPELKGILVTALPLFIGNSAIQINQIVDKSITSGLGDGAASALSYCQTLEQFVTNIMIVNIGNVMFANFAEYVTKGNLQEIQETLTKAINILIELLLAISIVTIVEAKDIVSIVYFRGNFTYKAVELTSLALIGYAISFAGVAVRDLSIKSMYAFKDTKYPMMASIISIGVNIFFSILLSRYIGVLGVSLATSISVFFGIVINAKGLKRHLKSYRYSLHIRTFLRCIPGGGILFLICFMIQKYCSCGYFLRFVLSGFVGFVVYFIVLYFSGVEEIKYVFGVIRHYMDRNKNIQS